MKLNRILMVATMLASPVAMQAQEPQPAGGTTQRPAPQVGAVVPLRVQVVFSEFEGEKKIGSLPYVLNHNAQVNRETRTSLRMGIRVPILARDNQIQYQDVGTDIDCFVRAQGDGTFNTTFELRRSSIYTPDSKQIEWKPNEPPAPGNPFFRNFSGRFDALLKDGQTTQTTVATDPVSGRTLRVDVTLNVVK